jgi:nucleoside-diphosphate-sugar epimerase
MKFPAEIVERLRPFFHERPVCVTGGAGFIGGHVVDALVSLGSTIRVLDDLSNSTLAHLAPLIELEPDRIRFVHGSVLDDEALEEACEGAGTIIHLAALGSVPRSIQEPQRTWSVNSTGTVRVLEAARSQWGATPPAGARIVFAASSSAYGNDPAIPKVETLPSRPLSPYAASKLAGEHAMSAWSASYGISTACLRYFNIFGPRQSADSAYAAVIAAFIRRLLSGEEATIYGDGSQTRDFTPVANAVYATLLAASVPTPLRGEAINVGLGRRTSLLELLSMLGPRCGVDHPRASHEPARTGDVPHSLADLSRARDLLGYRPIATLEDGLDETVAWSKRQLAGADRA